MATVAETRRASKKRREEQAKADAEATAAIKRIRDKRKKPETKKEKSFIDKIREALSTGASADAIAAIESGISEADAETERKRKR